MRSILDAAALLLDRDGIRGVTTNAVARVAGVSVGSLYQYFPDAKAIIAELARGLEATALAIAAEETVRMRDASARAVTARVVTLSCEPRFGTGRLRRILLREVPRGWILRESRSTDAMIRATLEAFFATRSGQVRPDALSRSVFVAQYAIEGLVEAVLLARPEALPTDAIQRELFHLAWSFLAEDGEPLDRPPVGPFDASDAGARPDAALAERLTSEPSRRESERKRSTSERALATRRALVDAGERLLARNGFDGASVRAVVAEAGCSVGAFYRHFASPLALAAEVAVQLERRAAATLASELEDARHPDELAEAVVRAHAVELGPLRRTLLAEIPRRSIEEAAGPVLAASIERLTQALARSAGELRAGDRELMAFFALHAVKSVTEAFVLHEPQGIDAGGLADALRALVRCYWERPTSGTAARPL